MQYYYIYMEIARMEKFVRRQKFLIYSRKSV